MWLGRRRPAHSLGDFIEDSLGALQVAYRLMDLVGKPLVAPTLRTSPAHVAHQQQAQHSHTHIGTTVIKPSALLVVLGLAKATRRGRRGHPRLTVDRWRP